MTRASGNFRLAETNKLTSITTISSSNIEPLIKATMFRWCVFLARTRHLRAFPGDFVISTRFICSRLFIWDVVVFNKGKLICKIRFVAVAFLDFLSLLPDRVFSSPINLFAFIDSRRETTLANVLAILAQILLLVKNFTRNRSNDL